MNRVYGAYGDSATGARNARSAYAGECVDAGTGYYLLGQRQYSPALRRFLSPDVASPFGGGGLNRYGYCGGDPIGRIDPSGNAWWDWVISGLSLVGALVGAVVTAGALAAPLGAAAAGSLTASVSMAMPATAAVLDVVAVTAEIGTLASMGAKNDKAAAIFGWAGMAGGMAMAGVAVAKPLAKSARFVGGGRKAAQGANAPRYNIDVVPADQLPPHKVRRRQRPGQSRVKTHWAVRTDPLESGSTHWGPDTAITSLNLVSPLREIGRQPIVGGHRNVYLYSGVHGNRRGENWANQRRSGAERTFYDADVDHHATFQRYLPARTLVVENIGGITFDDMIEKISRPGVHLHAYCYGAVDNLMLDLLGADPVPVYLKN